MNKRKILEDKLSEDYELSLGEKVDASYILDWVQETNRFLYSVMDQKTKDVIYETDKIMNQKATKEDIKLILGRYEI